jgi:hypothetical protein
VTAPTIAPRGFRVALADLRHVQKTTMGAPAYSRLVNRLGRLLRRCVHGRHDTDPGHRDERRAYLARIVTIATVSPAASVAAAVCLLLNISAKQRHRSP